MMKDTVIFDLDGTMALIEHRKHFVECDKKDQNWDAFYEACDQDLPNPDIIELFRNLTDNTKDPEDEKDIYKVLIFSGRSEAVREKTVQWLSRHTCFGVVKMWRSLGLTCLQVAAGDF